ncbi:MAG: ABC transporter substrate-binding protein [Solirubrobacteraceae bacterium]
MRRALVVALATVAALAMGCGGDDDEGGGGGEGVRGQTITVWSGMFEPDRLKATEDILADFTQKTGVKTKLVPLPEDQVATLITNSAAAGELPDVLMAISTADSHTYAAQGVFDGEAAQAVIDKLGPDTFSEKAIELVSQDGVATGVPVSGWGQLLIYRSDLFDEAGLEAPETLEDIRAAAEQLNEDDRVGITLATAPKDAFTEQSFEYVALAMGCQLVDDSGKVTFDSPECADALSYYADLANNFSVQGNQDVDSTRGTYFAGRAAMMIWSPFLLDGMAGLRDDTRPSCPQCKKDRGFLAKNSGLVGPIAGPSGEPSQYGDVATFNITTDANTEASQALLEFMMNEGYTRWLAISPQGQYPVRLGDKQDPEKFADAWAELESGGDRKAPLSKFYSEESIASLGEGVENFQRWGFPQGQGALLGALGAERPIAEAVVSVIGGDDPAEAAGAAQARIEEIQADIE